MSENNQFIINAVTLIGTSILLYATLKRAPKKLAKFAIYFMIVTFIAALVTLLYLQYQEPEIFEQLSDFMLKEEQIKV